MQDMGYFVWDADRVIVNIFGPFSLRWYSLFFLSGILFGNYLFHRMLEKEGKSTELRETLLYYIVIGTVVGARLGHVLFYDPAVYFSNPLSILKVWEGGLASHGGFTGVIVAIFVFSLRYKSMPFLWVADRVAICAVAAGGFIRIGNFFNSEIVGGVTNVPWAVIFAKLDSLPRHPTQLYEAAGYLSISLILYLIYISQKRKPSEGSIMGYAMIIAYSFRFAIESLKENQVAYEDDMLINMGQTLSVPFIFIGILLVSGVHHKLLKKSPVKK